MHPSAIIMARAQLQVSAPSAIARIMWKPVNTFPEEQAQIAAWMNFYGFPTLLAPDKDWAKNEYNVAFNPTNFLLDTEGRIIFKTDLQTFETTEQATHEVEMMLAHTAK